MKPNVLITGGAGFIGAHLAERLNAQGHFVRVMDSLSVQIHGSDPVSSALYKKVMGCAEFIKGDVRNAQDWLEGLKNIDVVVHLAAETGTGQSMYQVSHYCNTNVMGTAELLDLLANHKANSVQKLVLASSRAIYGEGTYDCTEHGTVYPGARSSSDMERGDFGVKCPYCGKDATAMATEEYAKPSPLSIYGVTKYAQEALALAGCDALGIGAVALRYQNVYGPGQSLSNPYTGILSVFSTRMLNGHSIRVFEDGVEARDFVFIDDVVEATARAVNSSQQGGKVFNVGTGVPTSVIKIATLLRNELGCDVPIEITGEYRKGDIRTNFANMQRIGEELNFTPSVDFGQGIKRFAAWVKEQRVMEDLYEKSMDELRNRGLSR